MRRAKIKKLYTVDGKTYNSKQLYDYHNELNKCKQSGLIDSFSLPGVGEISKSKFHYIKNLIWVKDNKIMGQTYMSQFEYIIMLRKGKHKRINNCRTSDVLQIPNKKMKDENNKTVHDTEKPVDLMKILIENSSNVGDVVFDPFMGIGATGLAATITGRDFIGAEIDERYFNIAKDRIESANIK